jgi:hypothetical protein
MVLKIDNIGGHDSQALETRPDDHGYGDIFSTGRTY